MIRSLYMLCIALFAACAVPVEPAEAGYWRDGVGGGGDVAAAWVTLANCDMTTESTYTFTGADTRALACGIDLYGSLVSGTSEINANGLHISHTGTSLVSLLLTGVTGLDDPNDDYLRKPIRITVQIDTTNSHPTPASNNGHRFQWETDSTSITNGAARLGFTTFQTYGGATWLQDAFMNVNGTATNVTGVGTIANFSEYMFTYLGRHESSAFWGDAASFPDAESDLTTLDGWTNGGTGLRTKTTRDVQFGNVTYAPGLLIGTWSGGGDVTFSQIRVEQFE